jgi:WD40 repeat protein
VHHQLIAVIRQSRLLIYLSTTSKILHSIPLTTQFASGCKRVRWYEPTTKSEASELLQPSPIGRVLLADDDTIHIYDAYDIKFHVTINGASGNTGRIAHVNFGAKPDEVIVFTDFNVKATIWSIRTSRGVEIRDPKSSSRGYSLRDRTGHLAILSRETTKDVVMVLSPARELEATFSLETSDAQGLSWSPDGRWLVTWDTATAGIYLSVYTPHGHLFATYSDGQDADCPGLGIRSISWDPRGHFLALACYSSQIIVLSTTNVS